MKPSLAFPNPHTPEFDVNRIKNISEKYLDISYASEKEHVLDLYLPEKKKEEYPLIIYIHEGAFNGKSVHSAAGRLCDCQC